MRGRTSNSKRVTQNVRAGEIYTQRQKNRCRNMFIIVLLPLFKAVVTGLPVLRNKESCYRSYGL